MTLTTYENPRVMCVAIKLWGFTFALPAPARHHTVLHYLYRLGQDMAYAGSGEQGFLLNDGRFASRKVALRVATEAGQLMGEPTAPQYGLFSEDVW